MIFARIQRGALRSSLLLQHKLQQFTQAPVQTTISVSRKAALSLLVARIITLPIPVHAATASAVGTLSGDDADPSLQRPLATAGVSVASSISFAPAAGEVFTQTHVQLASIQTGSSIYDEAQAMIQKAAEEAARAAAEAAKKTVHTTRTVIQLSGAQYDALFQKYFGDAWMVARAIGMAESGLNPAAISATNDYGVMQIHNGLASFGEQIFNPEDNIRIAADEYWKKRGFSPWSTYKNGAYLSYLEN